MIKFKSKKSFYGKKNEFPLILGGRSPIFLPNEVAILNAIDITASKRFLKEKSIIIHQKNSKSLNGNFNNEKHFNLINSYYGFFDNKYLTDKTEKRNKITSNKEIYKTIKKGNLWLTNQNLIFIPESLGCVGFSIELCSIQYIDYLILSCKPRKIEVVCLTNSLEEATFLFTNNIIATSFLQVLNNLRVQNLICKCLSYTSENLIEEKLPNYWESEIAFQKFLAFFLKISIKELCVLNSTSKFDKVISSLYIYGPDGLVISNQDDTAQQIYDSDLNSEKSLH